MASVTAEPAPNGTDSEERPVREQLKKASIAGTNGEVNATTTRSEEQNTPSGGVIEKVCTSAKPVAVETSRHDETSPEPSGHHTRKRSRDSTLDELDPGESRKKSTESTRDKVDREEQPEKLNGRSSSVTEGRVSSPDPSEDVPKDVASPKTKRTRLLSSSAEETTLTGGSSDVTSSAIETLPSGAPTEASKATASDAATGTTDKSPPPITSDSAFAASGFGALASSNVSGFGAIGQSSNGFGIGGSFATSAKSTNTANNLSAKTTEPASAFGGLLGSKSGFTSPTSTGTGFGSGASGFAALGKGGGGFGSTGSAFGDLPSGGLTSFARGKLSTFGAASKPSRPFGAPAAEDDEAEEDTNEDEEGDVKSPSSKEDERQDERFYEQDIETGEENEDIRYTCRAKLYNFANNGDGKKEWKERGLGTLRLNVARPTAVEGSKTKARLVMRADGSHRVVLNTPVARDIKFGSPTGGPPTGSYLLFVGTIDTVLEPLQLKMKARFALELYDKILELQREM